MSDSSTGSTLQQRLWRALERVYDPELGRPLTELGMVEVLTADEGGRVTVRLLLTIESCPAADRIERDVREALEAVLVQEPSAPASEAAEGVLAEEARGSEAAAGMLLEEAPDSEAASRVRVVRGVMSPEQRRELVERVRGPRAGRRVQFGEGSLTRVIAVTSGKGGVGKSSLTASLALALAGRGFRVGVVDADVYGFSVPRLLGLTGSTPTRVDDLIIPPENRGVKAISIGMLLGDRDPQRTAVSWRGPLLHRTLEQFLRDVWFGDIDFLLLDMPPGTGDIALSVAQLLPRAEVLVVTTPQPAASDVAVRSGLTAHEAGQRVLGVVENMSPTLQGGVEFAPFGSGGGQLVAERLSEATGTTVPLLARVPFSPEFGRACDEGAPLGGAADVDGAGAAAAGAEPGAGGAVPGGAGTADVAASAIAELAAALCRSPEGHGRLPLSLA